MDIRAYYDFRAIQSTEKERKSWVEKYLSLNPQPIKADGKPQLNLYFQFVLYEDDPRHRALLRDMRNSNDWEFAIAPHDKDVTNNLVGHDDIFQAVIDKLTPIFNDSDRVINGQKVHFSNDITNLKLEDLYINVPKKLHYHVIVKSRSKCKNVSILNKLSYYKPQVGKDLVCNDIYQCINYLAHKTIECRILNKYPYDWDIIESSSELTEIVEKCIKQYEVGAVSNIPELLNTIDMLAQKCDDANEVYGMLCQTKFAYMVSGHNFGMCRTFVDNAIKKHANKKRFAENELRVYEHSYKRYMDMLSNMLSRELRHSVSKYFTSDDLYKICSKFTSSATNNKETCFYIADCVASGFCSTVHSNPTETITLMFDRLDSAYQSYLSHMVLLLPLLCSFLREYGSGYKLKDVCDKFLTSETNFIRG